MRAVRHLTPFGAALLTLSLGAPVTAQQGSGTGKEHFAAVAVDQGGATGRSGTNQVDIYIDRWTTDAARDRMMTALRDKGPEELLKAMQKEPAIGRISTPGSLGYDLRYARQMPGEDGGRRIVLATDRPVGFGEARSGSRTLDYPLTLIELRVDKDGSGEGKLSIAVRPTLNGNVLVLEDYAQLPVMLTNVRKQK